MVDAALLAQMGQTPMDLYTFTLAMMAAPVDALGDGKGPVKFVQHQFPPDEWGVAAALVSTGDEDRDGSLSAAEARAIFPGLLLLLLLLPLLLLLLLVLLVRRRGPNHLLRSADFRAATPPCPPTYLASLRHSPPPPLTVSLSISSLNSLCLPPLLLPCPLPPATPSLPLFLSAQLFRKEC